MGGQNPYIEQAQFTPATKKYKITFLPEGKVVEVDPEKVPLQPRRPAGQHPGHRHGARASPSTMPAAGCAPARRVTSSSTRAWRPVNEATDAELDQLDEAAGLTAKSRLGCQCVPDGTQDIVVEIPDWNRNYAKEDH
jgi:Ferredoxin